MENAKNKNVNTIKKYGTILILNLIRELSW